MPEIQSYLNDISLMTFVFVWLGGVATSFTPCVYPLIPIVVGVIGGAKEKSRIRNFVLSFSYVIGISITFSVLGLAAVLTGRLFGQVQSSAVAHLIVGNVIILFGLALLGIIPLPTFLLSRSGAGKVRKGGSVFSALFMGMASGFVAAPCTAAVLGALLAFVSTTQNPVLGFSLLFTFAMGLGLLLILIGTFTGIVAALPKSEKFMHVVELIIAFGMILLGEYFVFRAGYFSV